MKTAILLGLLAVVGCVGRSLPEEAEQAVSTNAVNIACMGALEGSDLGFFYSVTGTAYVVNASAWVTVYGATPINTWTSRFRAISDGYKTAPVAFALDAYGNPTDGQWVVSVDRSTMTATISYADAEMPNGGQTWVSSIGECHDDTVR